MYGTHEAVTLEARACRFRMPGAGKRALWQITNRCNYRCRYCIFCSGQKPVEGELGTKEALKAVKEMAAAGFVNVKITGGEPLTRTDLETILEAASERGVGVDLSTNASLLDASRAARLAGAKPLFIHVGLDGHTAAINDMVRGRGSFNRTAAGIALLVHAGARVRIGCVIFRANQSRIGEMIEFASAAGAAEIVFSKMEAVGRLRTKELLCILPDRILAREIEQAAAAAGGVEVRHNLSAGVQDTSVGYRAECPGGDNFIYIDNFGRVAPCTWPLAHDTSLLTSGSLRERALSTVLGDPAIAAFIEKKGACAGCPARSGDANG